MGGWYGDLSQEELIGKAKAGDGDAFAELLKRCRGTVVSVIVACGIRERGDVEEVAQEVAVKVWRGLPSLKDAGLFDYWLRRIAANAARDTIRRIYRRGELPLDHALGLASPDEGGPQRRVERAEEMAAMLAVLESEDAEIRDLLLERAEGKGVAELAARVGIAEGALKMRLMRARKRLKKKLRRYLDLD